MEKRKAISKKLRFEIFKRDGFQCAYCGQAPPSVILEVDHIEPKAKGGKDDINNYITVCFDCNRGKKDIPLTKIPTKLSENIEVLKEKEEQLKEYRKFISKIEQKILKILIKYYVPRNTPQNRSAATSYFCGICWNIIKGKGRQ